MSKKIGVLDLGSNSLRLMVAAVEQGRIIPVRRELRETRLGQGLKPGESLCPEASRRTLEALAELKSIAGEEHVAEGMLVATSAVREASDGQVFLEQAARHFPFPARLLTAREEACFGFQGAVQALELQNGLVVDLGGRSTELSWQEASGEKRFIFLSIPLGAVRLYEEFERGSGPESVQLGLVMEKVRGVLEKEFGRAAVPFPPEPGLPLVGLGGTITTLAALDCDLTAYDPQRVHGHTISRAVVQQWIKRLQGRSLNEIQHLLSFAPRRADIFPSGVAAWLSILDFCQRQSVIVSEEGLLWGVLESLAEQAISCNGTVQDKKTRL